jgi:hypothetical protein
MDIDLNSAHGHQAIAELKYLFLDLGKGVFELKYHDGNSQL